MIAFLKSLIFKFRPFQIYPPLDVKKKNDGDTLSGVISKLKDVENRLVEAEKACDLRSSEQKLKDLEERFEEEMDLQFALGIQYDEDGDGSVTDAETHEYRQDRLYR